MPQLITGLDASGFDPDEATGFEPYEGPVPPPGVYAAVIKNATVRIGGDSGKPYLNFLFEFANQTRVEKQQYKGYPLFERFFVSSDADYPKRMIGKLIIAILPGKDKAGMKHNPVEDGGQITKVGSKDPVGTKCKIIVSRGDTQADGTATLRIQDLYPWPKDEDWPTGEFEEEEPEGEETEEVEEEETEADEPEEEEQEEEESDDDEEEDDDSGDEEDDDDVEAQIQARREELSALDRTAIKKVLKETDPDARVLKKHSDADLVEMIIDVEYPPVDDEGDDSEPPF